MAFTQQGVKFINKPKKGWIILLLFAVVELVFTIIFVISLSANILFPEKTRAVPGVSKVLSYQGRLTDAAGNPLGGSGTNYYFCFSIYDAASGGNKLWPSGAPSPMTVNVANGVFNVGIGSGSDDLGTFNFYENDTVYLNVEVATTTGTCGAPPFQTLSPRQRIDAVAYARATRDVYGDLLRTLNEASPKRVQIGTGSGSASPVRFALDVKNTSDTIGGACSPSGTIWYNSVNNRALVCDNSTIQEIGNLGTIVGIKEQATTTVITSGTVNFSAQANITINQNAQTLRFSVADPGRNTFGMSNLGNTAGTSGVVSGSAVRYLFVGGPNITLSQSLDAASVSGTVTISAAAPGGAATVSHWPPFPVGIATSSVYTGATAAGTNVTASFYVAPLQLEQNLVFNRIEVIGSHSMVAGTGSASLATMLGIYTLSEATLSRLSSFMFRNEVSQNSVTAQTHRYYWGTDSTANSSSTAGDVSSLFTGPRAVPLYGTTGSLSAGQYYLAFAATNVSAGINAMSLSANANISASLTTQIAPVFGAAVTARAPFWPLGIVSSTTVLPNLTTPFMPASIHTTAITHTGGTSQWRWPYVHFIWR